MSGSVLRRLLAGVAAALLLGGCAEQNLTLPDDAAPAQLAVVGGHGQEGEAGEWLAGPLVVEVRNAGGEPLPDVPVRFAFEAGSGVVNPTQTRTGADGRAQAAVRLGDAEGRHVIVATVEVPGAGQALRRSFEVFAVSGGGGSGDDDGGSDDEGGGSGDDGGGSGDDAGGSDDGGGDSGDGGDDEGGSDGDGGDGNDDGGSDGGEGDGEGEGATRPETLPVPQGHLPAPGRCRQWYPDRSPGQQPEETSCSAAIGGAPAGIWVVERRASNPGEAILHVIHASRPGVVVASYVYAVNSGQYLREA